MSAEFTMVEGGPNPPPLTVTLGNSGTDPLTVEVTSRPIWLSAVPLEGTVPPGGELALTLSADGTGAVANVPNTGYLHLFTNTENSSFDLPVTLTVSPP